MMAVLLQRFGCLELPNSKSKISGLVRWHFHPRGVELPVIFYVWIYFKLFLFVDLLSKWRSCNVTLNVKQGL